jgi:two-component system, chemotaxis family, sensor kinase CheA
MSPLVNETEFFESLTADFYDESHLLLEIFADNLPRLDRTVQNQDLALNADDISIREALSKIFRAVHSLKGMSVKVGAEAISIMTDRLELIIDAAGKSKVPLTDELINLFFDSNSCLEMLVDQAVDPSLPEPAYKPLLTQMEKLLRSIDIDPLENGEADIDEVLELIEKELNRVNSEDLSRPVEQDDFLCPNEPIAANLDPLEGVEDNIDLESKYLSLFIDEAESSLDSIAESFLGIEGSGGTRADLELLMIQAHRVKGSAAAVGLNRAAKLAHLMEDLLQWQLDQNKPLSSQKIESLFRTADALRSFVEGLKKGNADTSAFGKLVLELSSIDRENNETQQEPARAAEKMAPFSESSSDEELKEGVDQDWIDFVTQKSKFSERTWAGVVRLRAGLPLLELKIQLIVEKLKRLGEIIVTAPSLDSITDGEMDGQLFRFGIVTDLNPDEIRDKVRVAGIVSMEIVPCEKTQKDTSQSDPPSASNISKQVTAPKKTFDQTAIQEVSEDTNNKKAVASLPNQTLRVDIERLDSLLNLAGQLVIHKSRFKQILDQGSSKSSGSSGSFDNSVSAVTDVSNSLRLQLTEAIDQLDRISDDIQSTVMKARMVQIGPLFHRFKRVLRDICRASQKQVDLQIYGENTELDKQLIDELGEPLVHLIRNAADHGIEDADSRQEKGKPGKGSISLSAAQLGNRIVIQIEDDGAGLDLSKICETAIQKELISPDDIKRMTKSQIRDLIWEPGLSTASKVSDISGRGMGMDIVKSKIESLGGSVDIQSKNGLGTKVTIRLPLTLAVLPSLLVDVDEVSYAMPIDAVTEIIPLAEKSLMYTAGHPMLRVRDSVFPLVRLKQFFQNSSPTDCKIKDTGVAVLIRISEREIALAVDRVVGEESLVIKNIEGQLQDCRGIAGASILGSGRVTLILDLAAFNHFSSNSDNTFIVDEVVS